MWYHSCFNTRLTQKTSANISVSNNHVYGNTIQLCRSGLALSLCAQWRWNLVVGVDNVTVKDNNIKDNNFVGVATVSTLILGALAGLPGGFWRYRTQSGWAKIIGNVLGNNGTAPPVDYLYPV
jgi:hypothetical protein